MQDFEKLGVFYLGKKRDLATNTTTDELVLYDAKHLVTHSVVVGMTGSGKTGLCLDLLEEAAIDGIPVIAIDPKGDIGNLLLGFPAMRGADFEPWVDAQEAERRGLTTEAFAATTADTWKRGIESWGMTGERIARLQSSVDIAVYTPGSSAGMPLSVLRSFDVPSAAVLEDEELLRERIATTVTGLLGLVGITADPMQSREHILLSTLLDRAFREGRSLDLPTLIQLVQSPPFDKVGVLDLESFFPAKDRFGLVMTLNNLVASPNFAAWTDGEPLDVARLLSTRDGKPRVSILSIAHLDDAQRMFFVTLLLNQVLGWVRAQSGTSSLRAILYMDEIFGYFPPVANPPSKKPLLTLLKQARAFGLGVMLATQNPVDLDYKGLSNTGTWFIGRMQTERDKLRVLEGLEGAAQSQGAAFDRGEIERLLASLGNRVFLMNDVQAGEMKVFETRWAMSYLRGPMTRAEIKRLMDPRKLAASGAATANSTAPAAVTANVGAPSFGGAAVAGVAGAAVAGAAIAGVAAVAGGAAAVASRPPPNPRPALAPDVPQCFLPLRRPVPDGGLLVYRPMLLGLARVGITDTKAGVDLQENLALLAPITDEAVPVHWEAATPVRVQTAELARAPYAESDYVPLNPAAANAKKYGGWSKDLTTHLYSVRRVEVWKSPSTKLVSTPGEDERSFRLRLLQAARERRDAEVEKVRLKYAPKVAQIDEKIRRGHATVAREQAQAQESQVGAVFSVGSAVLGALTGSRTLSVSNVNRASTAARRAGKVGKERSDVAVAEESVQVLLRQREALEASFKADIAALDAQAAGQETLEPVVVKPKKSAITIVLVTLAWAPYVRGISEVAEPLWA